MRVEESREVLKNWTLL